MLSTNGPAIFSHTLYVKFYIGANFSQDVGSHIRKQAKRPRKHTSQRNRPNMVPIKISQPNRRNIIEPTHATPFHNTINIESVLVFAAAVDYMKKMHNSSLVRINHWAPSGHMGPAEYMFLSFCNYNSTLVKNINLIFWFKPILLKFMNLDSLL